MVNCPDEVGLLPSTPVLGLALGDERLRIACPLQAFEGDGPITWDVPASPQTLS